jgi:2-polyprenyl-3-methyl-5-hydroxy-6-metoxy-1,4-benzoquinol methylase
MEVMMDGETLNSYVRAYRRDNMYMQEGDWLAGYWMRRVMESLKPDSRVLDLGLGSGRTNSLLEGVVKRYVIVEGSDELISEFRRNHPDTGAEIIHSTFEDFDTRDVFDVIIMGFVLEHVHDPAFILHKYKAYLSTGGALYIKVPNFESLNKRIGYLAGMTPAMDVLLPRDIELGHRRLFSVKSLKEVVLSVGFKIDFIEGLLLKPITTGQMKTLGFDDAIFKALMQIGVDYPELSAGIFVKLSS